MKLQGPFLGGRGGAVSFPLCLSPLVPQAAGVWTSPCSGIPFLVVEPFLPSLPRLWVLLNIPNKSPALPRDRGRAKEVEEKLGSVPQQLWGLSSSFTE